MVQEPTPISISGIGTISTPSDRVPPSVTPAPTPTPVSSPFGMFHAPLQASTSATLAEPATLPAPDPRMAAEPVTAKLSPEARAMYLQQMPGSSPDPSAALLSATLPTSVGAAGLMRGPPPVGSIPGTNIPLSSVEPSALIRPPSPAEQLLGSLRGVPRFVGAIKRRLLSLRTPMPLIVATVLTLFIGSLLAIMLLSPTDQTKQPDAAGQVTGRFFNPAWTRVPVEASVDPAAVDTTSTPAPSAEPSATTSAGPTMAPPEPTGTDTSLDKRGKSGTGKPQKQRPKWF
jgi:hypothetical protein